VVAFHLGLPRAQAGYIGVDIFFVVSGFLITGILAAEADQKGTIKLGRFYARRIRRLVPAATLTIVAVLAATALLLSPLSWSLVAESSAAAGAYAANLYFAVQSDNYFAANVQDNPLLHFWSLAVEEQFYIVWPVLVLLASKFGATARLVTIGAVFVASLIHSIILTSSLTPWAYYSPLSRAWEFAAGGLLVLLLPAGVRGLNRIGREAMAWSGLGLIAASLILIQERTAFPGVAAIPTVLGTCLLIAAGIGAGSPLGRLLGLGPVQWLGAVSYSWYLWHWPFLVIGQIYLADERPVTRLLLVAASLVVAGITHHLVENPVRFAKRLTSADRPNWVLAGALLVLVLGSSLALTRSADSELATPELADLAVARDDIPALQGGGCNVPDIEFLLSECTLGPADATRSILIIGDSHAEMWTPILETLAEELDFRYTVHILGGCNALGLQAPVNAAACSEVQRQNLAVLEALQPDALIVSHFANNIRRFGETEWAEALARTLPNLTGGGANVGWIHDGPNMGLDPVECVASRGEEACTFSRAQVTDRANRMRQAEAELLADAGVLAFDPLDLMCNEEVCPLRSEEFFRYRDAHHITASFAVELAPNFRPFIEELLSPSAE